MCRKNLAVGYSLISFSLGVLCGGVIESAFLTVLLAALPAVVGVYFLRSRCR